MLFQKLLNYPQNLQESNIQKSISIIIPAYNEESRIKPVLDEICNYIDSKRLPWNIIVSIDGNDGTEAIVREIMAQYPFISILRGTGRNGKGGAIKRAVNVSVSDYIMLMDADGSISMDDMFRSLDLLASYDVIIFDRYSKKENNIPVIRRFASRGFNLLVRGILGIRVNDTQCGYKIMKSDYARDAFEKILVSNAFFDVALLYYIKKKGARLIEIPVKYRHGGGSKFNVFGLILGEGTSLFAFRLRNSRFYKYVPKKIVALYYRKFRWI